MSKLNRKPMQDIIVKFIVSEIESAYKRSKTEDNETVLVSELAKKQIDCKITELFATLYYLGYSLP